jgi:hypothetical protein
MNLSLCRIRAMRALLAVLVLAAPAAPQDSLARADTAPPRTMVVAIYLGWGGLLLWRSWA